MNAQRALIQQRWSQLQREMMGLWLRIEGFLLDGHIGPLISWRIYGFFSWDVYAIRWPPFGTQGVFKLRIHFAVCRFSFRRWKFERPGGASGTRIGVDWGLQGWQIGFDNGWQETKDRNKWIITRFTSFPGTYPYKILPWTWHPFWYPNE